MNKQDIDNYRAAVLAAMLTFNDGKTGLPRLTEQAAREILDTFTDEQLADGMPFNTPEETAAMLAEE